MFLALFVVIILLLLLGSYYLMTRFRSIVLKGEDPKKVSKEKRRKATLIALIPILPIAIWCILKPYMAVIADYLLGDHGNALQPDRYDPEPQT